MSVRMRRAAVLAGAVILTGCGSARSVGSPPESDWYDIVRPSSSRNVLTRYEIERARHAVTVADVIRQLRPEYLQAQLMGPGLTSRYPAVYVNGELALATDALEIIPAGATVEVRHYTDVGARSLFGGSCPCQGGAIVVKVDYRALMQR